jgi:hypothetical protein
MADLEHWARARTTRQAVAERARIVLAASHMVFRLANARLRMRDAPGPGDKYQVEPRNPLLRLVAPKGGYPRTEMSGRPQTTRSSDSEPEVFPADSHKAGGQWKGASSADDNDHDNDH